MQYFVDNGWAYIGRSCASIETIEESIASKLVQLKQLEEVAARFPSIMFQVQKCQCALYGLRMHIGDRNYEYFYRYADTELGRLDQILHYEKTG
ncbi:hypothetical protein HCH_00515 [Hahella chejuensis KCTC 2396]|uniref:Uncharacterized protein n=1 Tax=Hahella chejuensis (strain KCTC 2396) TaxID=349521 RepID=Q2SPK3_HAHCH|nr:hypothetical protein HCH_00515 [Hahella chejuensis KCTC 2396]